MDYLILWIGLNVFPFVSMACVWLGAWWYPQRSYAAELPHRTAWITRGEAWMDRNPELRQKEATVGRAHDDYKKLRARLVLLYTAQTNKETGRKPGYPYDPQWLQTNDTPTPHEGRWNLVAAVTGVLAIFSFIGAEQPQIRMYSFNTAFYIALIYPLLWFGWFFWVKHVERHVLPRYAWSNLFMPPPLPELQ